MMLADHILTQAGGPYDVGKMLFHMSPIIRKAQRFVMGRDAAEACLELLRNKPSNLIKALPLCRLPYEAMWIETEGGFSETPADRLHAPVPAVQGTLVESRGGQYGEITCAWVHAPTPELPGYHCNASPYGLFFDFGASGNVQALVDERHEIAHQQVKKLRPELLPVVEGMLTRIKMVANPPSVEDISKFMETREWRSKYAHDKREAEALYEHGRHMTVGISSYGLNKILEMFMFSFESKNPELFNSLITSWESDIEGEGPFTQFFITLLNSKNCVTREPVSMVKLNKARERRGKKTPLLDYTTVKLTMSAARQRAGEAQGMSRETMRQHLVRGHFKIRKHGVYWWHPFVRGDAARPMARHRQYQVGA